tara:strand:- start:102 stop:368 length:267 start_codon:yes stop_codon:yes gene_type:complete
MKRANKQLKKIDKMILNSKNGVKIFYIILALIVPPVWEFSGAFSSMIVGIFGLDKTDYTIRFFLSYPVVFSLGFITYLLIKIKDKIFK